MNSSHHCIVEAARYNVLRPAHAKQLEYIIRSTCISMKDNVLEIGCGTGNQIEYVRKITGCMATGIDRDIDRIRIARKQYPEINFIHSDTNDFFLKTNQRFGCVLLSAFIQNVEDLGELFLQIFRILLDGGFISLITTTPEQIKRFPEYKFIPGIFDYDKKRFWQKRDIIRHLNKSGFKITSIRYTILASLKYDHNYLKYIKEKPYSAFYNISESSFNNGLSTLEENIRCNFNKHINKNGLILIARKELNQHGK